MCESRTIANVPTLCQSLIITYQFTSLNYLFPYGVESLSRCVDLVGLVPSSTVRYCFPRPTLVEDVKPAAMEEPAFLLSLKTSNMLQCGCNMYIKRSGFSQCPNYNGNVK